MVDFAKIEKKWQRRWYKEKIFDAKPDKKKKKYNDLAEKDRERYNAEMEAYTAELGM